MKIVNDVRIVWSNVILWYLSSFFRILEKVLHDAFALIIILWHVSSSQKNSHFRVTIILVFLDFGHGSPNDAPL